MGRRRSRDSWKRSRDGWKRSRDGGREGYIPLLHLGDPLGDTAEGRQHRPGYTSCHGSSSSAVTGLRSVYVRGPWALIHRPSLGSGLFDTQDPPKLFSFVSVDPSSFPDQNG